MNEEATENEMAEERLEAVPEKLREVTERAQDSMHNICPCVNKRRSSYYYIYKSSSLSMHRILS
jgi:hypothetical protein